MSIWPGTGQYTPCDKKATSRKWRQMPLHRPGLFRFFQSTLYTSEMIPTIACSCDMKRIFLKTIAATAASLAATLAICFIFVPLMGGEMSGAGLVMAVVCPIAVGLPASLSHFYHAEKLRQANLSLEDAYRQLHAQSRRDALTGVLNRTAFMAELQGAQRCRDCGRPAVHRSRSLQGDQRQLRPCDRR